MDKQCRAKEKHLNDIIESLRQHIHELTDVNHYLMEQNRRLLMTINLLRLRSPSAPPILRSNSANLSSESSEENSEENSQLLKF